MPAIKIACKGAGELSLSEFERFQGKLKYLDKENIERGKKSIAELGFSFPICVWKQKSKGKIIDGHQRLFIVEQMLKDGWTLAGGKLPVAFIEAKDEKEAKRKVLAATSQYGRITESGLFEFLELAGLDAEAVMNGVRFPEIDLDEFLNGYYFKDNEGKTHPDDCPRPPKKAESKLGDVYLLGDHRLLCGDSTKVEIASALMKDEKAQLVFTDPPYNVNYSGRGEKTKNKIMNDNMAETDFRKFLTGAFATMKECTTPNAPAYVCYASRTHREFEDALNANDYEVRNQIIWVKAVASMGWGDYRWKHEPILYCHKRGESVQFYGDRCQYTEWSEKLSDEELLARTKQLLEKEKNGATTVWRLGRDRDYEHPTQKPTKLIKIAIRNSTKHGEIVLDLFGGSGSTLIACEETGRKARLVELDPIYCDVIVKRWEEFTGKKAELTRKEPKAKKR
jgi:DNA modification methylase